MCLRLRAARPRRQLILPDNLCYNMVVGWEFHPMRAARSAVPDIVRIQWSKCHV